MLLLILVTLYPFWHVAMSSISNPSALIIHSGPVFIPIGGFEVGNYGLVFKNPMIPLGYSNTIKYLVIGTTLNLIMTMFCAYALSRKHLMLRNHLMYLIIFTMYFSGGMIPSFLLVKSLGIYDTLWALVLPGSISTYNMIIMRSAFAGVPDSMEESAKLDGANDMIILFRIIIPLCMPTIAVMILFYGVGHWNSWFSAMIYLKTRAKFPLQLVLREILLANTASGETMVDTAAGDKIPLAETVKYATIMVATVPILAVYPFLQKYFIKGIMIGAIKG
jgi:putative aldouronate transport system permease protein